MWNYWWISVNGEEGKMGTVERVYLPLWCDAEGNNGNLKVGKDGQDAKVGNNNE